MSSSAVETESSNDSKDVVILADDEHSSTDNSMHAYEEASHSKPQVGSKRSLPAEAGPLAKEPKIRNDSVRSGGEANCPICLNALTDATVLNACPHVFCYGCICEWLKMKAECPLCKRSLQYLKHSLCPAADEKPTFESQGEIENISELRSAFELEAIRTSTSYAPEVERFAVTEVIQRVNRELDFIRSVNNTSYTRDHTYNDRVEHLRHELRCYEELLQVFDHASRSEIFDHPCFRRVIYIRNLTPRAITPARFALAFTPAYVRENEATIRTHILRFVVRDITAMTGNDAIDVDHMLDKIMSYLRGDIKRLEITTFLSSRGVRHPHHFLNNLQHFGESGQTLQVYDQNTEYVPRTDVHRFHRHNDDDVIMMGATYNNDVQVVGGAQREANLQRTLARERLQHAEAMANLRRAEAQTHQRELDVLANRRRLQHNDMHGFSSYAAEPPRHRLFSPRRESRHRNNEVLQLESESEDSDSDVEVMRHQRSSPPRGLGASNRRVLARGSPPRHHDPSVTDDIRRLRSNFSGDRQAGEGGSMFRNYGTTFNRDSGRSRSPRAERRHRYSSSPPTHHRGRVSFGSALNATGPAEVSSGDEDIYTHSSCRLPRTTGTSTLHLPQPRYGSMYADGSGPSGSGWFQRSSLLDTLRNFLGNATSVVPGPTSSSYAPPFAYGGSVNYPQRLPVREEPGPTADRASGSEERADDNDVQVIDDSDVEVTRDDQRRGRYGNDMEL